MPVVISHVDSNQQPQEGELALVKMTRDDRTGFRLSARSASTGRRLGGWVSNCPRSVADAAYMWLFSFGWKLQADPESQFDFEAALSQPLAVDPEQVPILDVVDLLRENFAPPAPAPAPAQVGARPGIVRAALPAPSEPAGEQDVDMGEAMRRLFRVAVRGITSGMPPAQAREQVARFFGVPPDALQPEFDAAEFRQEMIGALRALNRGDSPDEVAENMVMYLTAEDDLDEELEEEAEAELRYRPLGPDEEPPPGMKLPPEDPRLREKMDRTIQRANAMRARADAGSTPETRAQVEEARRRAQEERIRKANEEIVRPAQIAQNRRLREQGLAPMHAVEEAAEEAPAAESPATAADDGPPENGHGEVPAPAARRPRRRAKPAEPAPPEG
jgi:hypothetical protein